jgi:hypothetical protein
MYQDTESGLGSDDPFSQSSFGEQAVRMGIYIIVISKKSLKIPKR